MRCVIPLDTAGKRFSKILRIFKDKLNQDSRTVLAQRVALDDAFLISRGNSLVSLLPGDRCSMCCEQRGVDDERTSFPKAYRMPRPSINTGRSASVGKKS